MRGSLLLLIPALLAASDAVARARAVGHRSSPWATPACTVSTGLPSSGSLHGATLVRSKERSDPWSSVFTYGLALGAAPNTLYATRGGAIYESTDAGCTWHIRASVPEALQRPGDPARVITQHSNRIYAYTSRHIVRVTYDTVETFALPTVMQQVAVDPADPLHLRAIGTSGIVYDSHDGARTWTRRGMVTASLVLASEFDPTNFDRIILHTGAFGAVAITTDGGKSWTYQTQTWWRVDALEISPADPKVVWLSGAAGVQSPELYRSTDGGKTFTQVVDYTSMMTHSSDMLAAHPTDPRVVAVPLNIGIAIVTETTAVQRFTERGTWEAVWSPAGTLYFIDQQFRY
ncbi:MAG TPA: hypothetical protein VF883_20730 [Thermoanaerobaculia bacterium]|jgi:hypothetical protein